MNAMQLAYALLPDDAEWSCSFGNPGERGFNEYFRCPDGERWIISNCAWGDEWSCRRAESLVVTK